MGINESVQVVDDESSVDAYVASEEPSADGTGECIRTRIFPSSEGVVSKEISKPLRPPNAPSTNSSLRVLVECVAWILLWSS